MPRPEPLTAVLLPGMDGTGKMFGPLISQFPAWITPQVLDYPTQETLTYPELVSRLLPRLPRNAPFFIVAESFAGPLALMLSQRSTDQLKALVLCASFVSNPRPWLSRLAPLVLHEWVLAQPPRKWMARLFVTGRDAPDEILEEVFAIHKHIPARVTQQRLQEVLAVNVRTIYQYCRLPMLHLYALHDRLITQYPTREMQHLRPDVPSVGIDGPHFLLQMRPALCYNAIRDFLFEHNLASGSYEYPGQEMKPIHSTEQTE